MDEVGEAAKAKASAVARKQVRLCTLVFCTGNLVVPQDLIVFWLLLAAISLPT